MLWDVKALGCLTYWAGTQMIAKKEFQVTQAVSECDLDAVTYDASTKVLLMGEPLTFTKDTSSTTTTSSVSFSEETPA